MKPKEAAEDVVKRMLKKYPRIRSGVVVVDKNGEYGGAGSGWTFSYSVRGGGMNETQAVEVPPVEADREALDAGATAHDGFRQQREL